MSYFLNNIDVNNEFTLMSEPHTTKVACFWELLLRLRSLVFKFPPDKSGNPYSYRRVHFASTV